MSAVSYTNKVLTGDQLVFYSGLVKTALADKQDALEFNSEYDSRDNKVATMSDLSDFITSRDIPDVSGLQEALVFNTAYDATNNKVATMSDLSGKQDSLVFNTAYNASSNKVATMSDVSGKQDALVFNTAYNASSNKVATMSDITSALSGITSFSFEIVQALPQSNISTSKIYLVAKSTSGTNQVYTEYAYVNNAWEIIGDTAMTIDTLSNSEVQTIWEAATVDAGL